VVSVEKLRSLIKGVAMDEIRRMGREMIEEISSGSLRASRFGTSSPKIRVK
jgi:hypothetical protein